MTAPALGIIEGYYGRPWPWTTRRGVTTLLAEHGYTFYHYAPKSDPHVREQWREPWPSQEVAALTSFADHCRACGMRFGIGLSPAGLQSDQGQDGLARLLQRVQQINHIGADDLLLLFDDIAGDDGDSLALRQADLAHRVADTTHAERLFVCPTYYSDDPLLDHLFGRRPANYLQRLGERLDPAVSVYWAGEEICPAEITPGSVAGVTDQLGRRPVLWDNYPVNDGGTARDHLHLRGFTGRSAALAGATGGHAINPALQGWLSCIPALTLPASYRDGEDYRYGHAQQQAAKAVLGPELGEFVLDDLPLLADRGRDRLTGTQRSTLLARYQAFDHPGAREIVDWLNGEATDETAPTGA